MSEAYEIGVTLALSDGVSDGIKRARREIDALQRALMTGGVSMAQLRRTAIEGNLPAKRQFEQRDADRKLPSSQKDTLPPSLQSADRILVEARPSPATSTDVSAPKMDASAANNRAHWGEKQPPPVEAAQGVVKSSVAPQTASVPNAPSLREAVRDPAPAVASEAITLGKMVDGRTFAPAPRNTILSSQQKQSQREIVRIEPTIWPKAWNPVIAQTTTGVLPRVKYSRTAAAPPPNHKQSKSSDESAAFDRPLVDMPAAPQAMKKRDGSGGSEQVAQPRLVAPTMPSVSGMGPASSPGPTGAGTAQGAPGPVEGDVYLDGMLVGRWMSRFLAQEAGRASVGPTGFDGRRGWLLPGATVGT